MKRIMLARNYSRSRLRAATSGRFSVKKRASRAQVSRIHSARSFTFLRKIASLLAFWPMLVWAATFTLCLIFSVPAALAIDAIPIQLEKANVNIHDRASILRGAKWYAQNCMVCHTMKHLQHDSIAEEAGITQDKMPYGNTDWWMGVVPPDLSLVASYHTPDWLFTYFHAFYVDPSQPLGSNNLLKPNSSMANLFQPFQGEQVLVTRSLQLHSGWQLHKPHYYSMLRLERPGSMTPEQFDAMTNDLVNFFVYASDPNRLQRENIGRWVLGFLFIFFVISWFLYRDYWNNIK